MGQLNGGWAVLFRLGLILIPSLCGAVGFQIRNQGIISERLVRIETMMESRKEILTELKTRIEVLEAKKTKGG